MPPLTIFGQTPPAATTDDDPLSGIAPTTPSAPATTAAPATASLAMKRINDLETQKAALTATATSTDPKVTTTMKQVAQTALTKLEPALSSAYRDEAANERANARALISGATSSPAQMLQANAAQARADALTTRADAYAEGTGPKRAQLEADTVLKNAQAAEAQAKADLAVATNPTAIDQAKATLAKSQQDILTAQAGVDQTRASTALTTAQTTGQNIANTANQASANLAPQTAQAVLDKAQGDVTLQQQQIADLKAAQARLPTGDQAQAGIQNQLDQALVDLATKQNTLDQAKQLMPGVVAQQGATLASTQAGTASTLATTQQNLLGAGLYGAQQRVQAMKDLIKSGSLSPEAAAAQLQAYISATVRGTTVADEQKNALDAETSRYSSNNSLAGNLASVMGSGFSSALSTFGKLNDTVAPGSDLVGRGFIASQRELMDKINSFRPTQDSALLNSMRGVAPAPVSAAAPALAPAPALVPAPAAAAPSPTTDAAGHTITINIGGTGAPAATPLLPPGVAGTSGDPRSNPGAAPNPAFLRNAAPAFPNHVEDAWANDPNLHPELATA